MNTSGVQAQQILWSLIREKNWTNEELLKAVGGEFFELVHL